jgi:hypothetical protein
MDTPLKQNKATSNLLKIEKLNLQRTKRNGSKYIGQIFKQEI